MKKIFCTFVFTLLLVIRTSGQVDIDIPLDVTDGSYITHMNVGLDLTATNCIDPQLGESDLPPVPPTGMFDVRFDLSPYGCPGISSYKDYRAPGNPPAFPFTGMIQHTLWWQVSSPEAPIEITYNLPPGAFMTLTDQIGGIFLNIGPFVGQGVATIPGNYTAIFSKAFLKIQYCCIGGEPTEPIFGISTMSLNFPQMIAGNDTTLPVTVTNVGIEDTLSITNIVSSNSHFTITPTSVPIILAPQDSQIFQVTNTAAVNAEQGTIQFTHNGCGSPTAMNVSAPAGIPPGPLFAMSATSLIFIQDTVGTVDSLPVTISNNGYANTLYINYISSNNSHFSVYPNSFPIAIEPQTSLDIFITYTSDSTLQQGIIEITHNAPGSPNLIYVSSASSFAQFSIYPASLYFNWQPSSRTVWIENTGSSDTLIINNITSSNNNYTVTPNVFPVCAPPGVTKIFTVSLNNTPGFQFAVIKIYHNATGSPYLLFATNQLFPPVAEGTIIIHSGPMSQTLKFGIDSLASDDIDELLGEMDIPPPPPQGVFDARYIMPINNFSGSLNSLRDFRYGTSSFVGQKEYRLAYQKNYDYGIEISWDLPEEITGVLRDLFDGSFINVPIADSGSFTIQDPLTFSKLKMLINFNTETPVELFSFNATLVDDKVKLNWTTATETNNSGFEIQRLQDSKIEKLKDWETIGFVPGYGTTTEPKSYSFIDENTTAGTYKYRLKQIDFDGSFTYSNEIEVIVDFTPKEFVLYQNYPNPFNPITTIKFTVPSVIASGAKQSQLVTLKVYDILGNEIATLVNEEKQPGVYEVEFDGSLLASGMYVYKLQAGTFIQTKKMTLLK
jgi:hypothetical protein